MPKRLPPVMQRLSKAISALHILMETWSPKERKQAIKGIKQLTESNCGWALYKAKDLLMAILENIDTIDSFSIPPRQPSVRQRLSKAISALTSCVETMTQIERKKAVKVVEKLTDSNCAWDIYMARYFLINLIKRVNLMDPDSD